MIFSKNTFDKRLFCVPLLLLWFLYLKKQYILFIFFHICNTENFRIYSLQRVVGYPCLFKRNSRKTGKTYAVFSHFRGRLERVKSPINLKENHILECCTCNPASLHYIFSYVFKYKLALNYLLGRLVTLVSRAFTVFSCNGLLR